MARPDGKDRGLFERPKASGIWWVRWSDQHGKEHREKVGPKSAARQLYQKRKEEARVGTKLGVLNRKEIRLSDLFLRYAGEMTTDRKPKAIEAFNSQEKLWLSTFGDDSLTNIRPGDLEAWKTKRLNTVAPATVNRSLALLKRLFSLAVRDQLVEVNPLSQGRVRMLQENNQRERFLNSNEEQALSRQCPWDFWLAVLFALHTGLRQSEQFQRKRSDVDIQRKILTLPTTKAGERQHILLNSVALETLKEILESHSSEWLFPGPSGKTPITGNAVTHRLQRLCLKAETALRKEMIDAGRPDEADRIPTMQDVCWHTLRHTYISRLCLEGTPLPTVKKLARHKSLQMTLRYAHLCPSHEAEALDNLAKRYPNPKQKTEPARKPALKN